MSTAKSRGKGIKISFLNATLGDREKKFQDTPEGRKKLAKKILKMIKSGAACFLIVGTNNFKIKSYDAEANEWLVYGTQEKLSGEGKEVLVVAPVAGG